jgi:hypothetical protein
MAGAAGVGMPRVNTASGISYSQRRKGWVDVSQLPRQDGWFVPGENPGRGFSPFPNRNAFWAWWWTLDEPMGRWNDETKADFFRWQREAGVLR